MPSPGQSHTPTSAETSSGEHSTESSTSNSRSGSRPPRGHRVQFAQGGESLDASNQRAHFDVRDEASKPLRRHSKKQSPKPLPKPRTRSPVSRVPTGPRRPSRESPERTAARDPSPPANASSPAIFSLPSDDSDTPTLKSALGGNSRRQSDEGPGKLTHVRSAHQATQSDAPEIVEAPQTVDKPTESKDRRRSRFSANFDNDDNNDSDKSAKAEQGEEGEEREEGEEEDIPTRARKEYSETTARERAETLSRNIGSASNIRSLALPQASKMSPPGSPEPSDQDQPNLDLSDLAMKNLKPRRHFGIDDDTDSDNSDEHNERPKQNGQSKGKKPKLSSRFRSYSKAASRLMRHHTDSMPPSTKRHSNLFRVPAQDAELRSGQVTPVYDRDRDNYVPRPEHYREGYLSTILKLYREQGADASLANIRGRGSGFLHSRTSSQEHLCRSPDLSGGGLHSPTSSGQATPKKQKTKWYYKNPHETSTTSIASLVGSSTVGANVGSAPAAIQQTPGLKPPRPDGRQPHRPKSVISQALENAQDLYKARQASRDAEVAIQVHLTRLIVRQQYLLKLCKALISYGAPTHRLEEYMRMSARTLEIDGQFLYIPGCMIISFDDSSTHTTEVKIVRTSQGVDLGKLRDVHGIYKNVVHGKILVDEAMEELEALMKRPVKFKPWLLVPIYGLASVTVGPFAFQARPIDLPICFLLGSILGWLSLVVAPMSELYSNVFEITAAMLTSFLARAFGSIHGGNLFCFSALAQSSIALILPGYTVLCGSLELQSRNIVPGSVRMVYAVIYSLFLGFGITIGTAIFGALTSKATSDVQCRSSPPVWLPWICVPLFTLCLIIINQGKAKQMPAMVIIAFAGYVVNHFTAIRFPTNSQVAQTLGALCVGVLGNLYSRLRHGVAAAALLPAIFVQVPSGIAASGSLVSGIVSANQITNNTQNATIANSTTTVSDGTEAGINGLNINSTVFNVGYSMIQVAIGITVGLFLSALVVYPFGKRRSGLFSF